MTDSAELPFVDEYSRHVTADRARTWQELERYAERLTTSSHGPLTRILGTVPRSGFEVAVADPPHEIVLVGRHRFSTYRLVFRVEPDGEGSRLYALTYADFPGLRGRAYRTMLMVSTGHRRATQGMLHTIAQRAER